MKNKLIILAGVASLIAFSTSTVRATEYDLAYVQIGESDQYGNAVPRSVTDAIGVLDVVGGVAIGGTLNVISGPDAGNYTLVTGSGSDANGFDYTSVVNTLGGPFLPSVGGLLWMNGSGDAMNMWYNSIEQFSQPAGSYSLWGAPPEYNPESYGTATLTYVPDGGMTVSMLGLAVGVCGLFARKMRKLA